ncbi:transposase [Pseudomonas quasicaspiana]|nr:transposase [Pseudomonas quasicaspiana]
MLIAPRTGLHILLLQLLYSVPSEQQLYEQLNYNLLFRWFVGLDLNQKVWSFNVLAKDLATLLNDQEAVQLIQKIIGEVFCGALLQMPEFSLNFALLHTWLSRHAITTTSSN